MRFLNSLRKQGRRFVFATACAGLLGVAGGAQADSCRDWTQEHWAIRSDVVRLFLSGAPQEVLDAAVFELLQREAYMTSCDPRTVVEPAHQLGWRLIDRDPDDYAAAVVQGLLADAGLDPSLTGLFAASDLEAPLSVSPPTVAQSAANSSTLRR